MYFSRSELVEIQCWGGVVDGHLELNLKAAIQPRVTPSHSIVAPRPLLMGGFWVPIKGSYQSPLSLANLTNN